jgi:hypothetical protein
LNRLFFGILIGIGLSVLYAAAGFDWPGIKPTAAASAERDDAVPAAAYNAPRGPLVVHRPVPHPALLAAGQLFISLYALIALHTPKEETAA